MDDIESEVYPRSIQQIFIWNSLNESLPKNC